MRIALVLQVAVRFVRNRSGNFATIFALLAPIFLGVAGGVVDLVVYDRQETKMQDAADAAVLAATKEASLSNWSQSKAESVARSYAEVAIRESGLSATAQFVITTVADAANRQVSITLDMDQHHYFVMGYFRKSPQIRVTAAAKLSSETPVCLLALDPSQSKAINVIDSAAIDAPGCAAHSNSTDKDGLYVEAKADMTSAFSCSSGGFGSKADNFSPAPTTDCPPFPDPLANRPQPLVGKCDHKSLVIKNVTTTINPGVYCNGLLIDNWAIVTMKPGIYIIDGGELGVKNSGTLKGEGVTLFFTGKDGRLKMDGTTTVNLAAPETGLTAGLLMMQDRDMDYADYEISSKSAAELLGTIYLPNGRLFLDAPGNIGEASAFTVVVTRTLEVGKKTRMFLNSNYGASAVPVPNGLAPSKSIRLIN